MDEQLARAVTDGPAAEGVNSEAIANWMIPLDAQREYLT
jgi:hypothetical protein